MRTQYPTAQPSGRASSLPAIVPRMGQTLRSGAGQTWVVTDMRYSAHTGRVLAVELLEEGDFHAGETARAFVLDLHAFEAFCREKDLRSLSSPPARRGA